MTSEAEGVAERGFHFDLARGVGAVVEWALRVLVLEIDGGRDDAIADRHKAGEKLDSAGRSEEVAGHGFGGADDEAVF